MLRKKDSSMDVDDLDYSGSEEALLDAGLTCKLKKCMFFTDTVEYVGFEISKGKLRPGKEKVKAISEFERPTNQYEVRRFLGMSGFFRRFIKNFAQIASPLTELTRKNAIFEWTDRHQQSFESLKSALINKPVLALYDPTAETEVHCDASSKGLAGLLLQKGKDNQFHLVSCFSQKTTTTEMLYHSSRLELMAIVKAVEKFRQYLIAIPFTVVTDCKALTFLNKNKSLNPQTARWAVILQEYQISYRYRPGEKMQHADALSRAPVNEAVEEEGTPTIINDRVFYVVAEKDKLATYQREDPSTNELVNLLIKYGENGSLPDPSFISFDEFKRFTLLDGVLYRIMDNGEHKFVLPKSMRKSILIKYHDLQGHYAVEKTLEKIRSKYWFSKMRAYVRNHISRCVDCISHKPPSGKIQGLSQLSEPGSRPFIKLHVDHLGPFVTSTKGSTHVFVVKDSLSSYTILFSVPNVNVNCVKQKLSEVFADFGIPRVLVSDQGSAFTSYQFADFMKRKNIHHTLISVRRPNSNGLCERANKIVTPQMNIYTERPDQRDWDKLLPEIQQNMNATKNRSTGKTPFELVLGYNPNFDPSALTAFVLENDTQQQNHAELWESAKRKISESQLVNKQYLDQKRVKAPEYQIGQIVFIKFPPSSTGMPTKTHSKFRGPMVIVKKKNQDVYEIESITLNDKGETYRNQIHASHIRKFGGRLDEEDSDVEN